MMTARTSPASTSASNRAMPGRFRLLADSPPSTMMSIKSALWTTAASPNLFRLGLEGNAPVRLLVCGNANVDNCFHH